MEIREEAFGQDPQGLPVKRVTLTNRGGASISLMDFGAHLLSVRVPGKSGELGEVTLGYDSCPAYAAPGSGYLGATVGRYANRIAGAAFMLNGREYRVSANEGRNCLHGGARGFNLRRWSWEIARDGDAGRVRMKYVSADGEEGFPGELRVETAFSFDDENRLCIEYSAVSDADTVISLTNHAYFNLAGAGDILGHWLMVDADGVLEVDQELLPTGKILPVADSLYDLREFKRIGELVARRDEHPMFRAAGGFDSGYVLNGEGLRRCAQLQEPGSGRTLTVFTDQPGLQVYSGQKLRGTGRGGVPLTAYGGLALETQRHPDSMHHPHFGSCVLRAGDRYTASTVYAFGTL